ncbi:stalk domain-containing protein [Aureibacillus halotolerans]|uniref:Copper amine oxidase-like protein n=1 Tax=Aureibacillus halotolerans TaxID=1508390 RepID=A0A4R6TUC5_9BACI|nr:stalk domain-containing protein [Aureibacillus halotolerans]TDQ33793.1 copper amine oxidase-like protein [Aureibacillus halotolerans]
MKIRIFIAGLVIGGIVTSTTTLFAADFIKATLYPVTLVINSEEKEIPENQSILNYNNHTYVPLRWVADQMNAEVDYRKVPRYDDTIISIKFPWYEGDADLSKSIPGYLIRHVGEEDFNEWLKETDPHYQVLETFMKDFGITEEEAEQIKQEDLKD